MANYIDHIAVIRARFRTQWQAMHPDVPFIIDNEAIDDEPVGCYVRLSIRPGVERRLSMFPPKYEQQGRIYFQVMIPRDDSDREGWQLATTFGSIFRDWHSPDYQIRCDVAETTVIDNPDDRFVIRSSVFYTAQH